MKVSLPPVPPSARKTLGVIVALLSLYLALAGCTVLEEIAGAERNLADPAAQYVVEICALERAERTELVDELNQVVRPHEISIRCAKAPP